MALDVHTSFSKLDFDDFAAALSLDEHPHEYALYIRAARYIKDRFLAYVGDPSAAFVRLGGSVGQGLALLKHADLDLIFFKRPVRLAYLNDHQDFMIVLQNWIKHETSAVTRTGEWFIELVPGGLREKSITIRLKSSKDWSVDVDMTLASDIHAGLPAESADPNLRGLPLTKYLSTSDARKLYTSFHASIRHMLECSNTLEADAPGSRIAQVREQAKSYVDCFVALTKSLPLYVRHAILILKAWSNQFLSHVLSYDLPFAFPEMGASGELFSEDELRTALKKRSLSSYALTVVVVYISRQHLQITSCKSLTIKVLKFFAELETLEHPMEICLDDFYLPTCWPQFKARDRRKIHIRDPINPTNDLAFRTCTQLLVGFGKVALRSSAFVDMLLAGPPQMMKIRKITLPSDAEELNDLTWDMIVRYLDAQDEIYHNLVKQEVHNDEVLEKRRLRLLLKSCLLVS